MLETLGMGTLHQQWWLSAWPLVGWIIKSGLVQQEERSGTLLGKTLVKHCSFTCPLQDESGGPGKASGSVRASAPAQGTAGTGAPHHGFGVCVWYRSGWLPGSCQREDCSVQARTCRLYIGWTSCAWNPGSSWRNKEEEWAEKAEWALERSTASLTKRVDRDDKWYRMWGTFITEQPGFKSTSFSGPLRTLLWRRFNTMSRIRKEGTLWWMSKWCNNSWKEWQSRGEWAWRTLLTC